LLVVVIVVMGIGLAAALTLLAFQQNLLYFVTPTEIKTGKLPEQRQFRVGGLVVEGSVRREGVKVEFDLTDTANSVKVVYTGILPDLFREGQGIVANGKLNDGGIFVASEVLAKHDENYMPPEVADALKTAKDLPEKLKEVHR
jgi:cytochrome c-type biogenesis protein CcmE